jgi:hypothetical protein
MPISHKYKVIFVHIPKTAGTSVEKFLEIPGLSEEHLRSHKISIIDGIKYAPQHLTANMIKTHDLVKDYWDNYFKFSIVRHPYTRALSEYFWRKGKTGQNLRFNPTEFSSFLNLLKERKSDHDLSQYDYLYNNGKLLVDNVGKYEDLKTSINTLCKYINESKDFPITQKSSNKNSYINFLTSKHKDKIIELYNKDFEFFNYKK